MIVRVQPILFVYFYLAATCHLMRLQFGDNRCVTKKIVEYANVHSFTKPIAHSPSVPFPLCSKNTNESYGSTESSQSDVECIAQPKLFTQPELNGLIRDLDISKEKSEMMASRLAERTLLTTDCKITYYRDRHKPFAKYYLKKGNICYCHDIPGLFKEFGEAYDSMEWRLFIDSSKLSLKAVLLHQGNRKPSIPLAHAVNTKESYESMGILLDSLKYNQHEWKICADLKVVVACNKGSQNICVFCANGTVEQDESIMPEKIGRIELTLLCVKTM